MRYNKLPPSEGILRFPISMARISNSQDAKSCFEYISHINPSKVLAPKLGVNFCYTDFLYSYSQEEAVQLKKKFSPLITDHTNACKNIIRKPYYIDGSEEKKFFYRKSVFFGCLE